MGPKLKIVTLLPPRYARLDIRATVESVFFSVCLYSLKYLSSLLLLLFLLLLILLLLLLLVVLAVFLFPCRTHRPRLDTWATGKRGFFSVCSCCFVVVADVAVVVAGGEVDEAEAEGRLQQVIQSRQSTKTKDDGSCVLLFCLSLVALLILLYGSSASSRLGGMLVRRLPQEGRTRVRIPHWLWVFVQAESCQ